MNCTYKEEVAKYSSSADRRLYLEEALTIQSNILKTTMNKSNGSPPKCSNNQRKAKKRKIRNEK